MDNVIVLKDGSVEVVMSAADFEHLIEKHMGHDSLKYFENLIEELQDEVEDHDPDNYLLSLESNTACFQEIISLMDQMKSLLEAPRMNRSKMSKLVGRVNKEIYNQI